MAIDFKTQQYRNKPVLTWWEGTIGGTGGQGVGQGEFVIADKSYREITRVRAAGTEQADQHDFVITPRGHGAVLGVRPDPVRPERPGRPGGRRAARRRDPGDRHRHRAEACSSGGRTSTSASTSRTRRCPQGDSAHLPYDYFHAELGRAGRRRQHHHVVPAHLDHYKIDRRTGKIIWRLGGKKSDFAVDERAKFAWQHDFRQRRDGTYSVFDNGTGVTKVARATPAAW